MHQFQQVSQKLLLDTSVLSGQLVPRPAATCRVIRGSPSALVLRMPFALLWFAFCISRILHLLLFWFAPFFFPPLFWWSTFSRSFLRFEMCAMSRGVVMAARRVTLYALDRGLLQLVHGGPSSSCFLWSSSILLEDFEFRKAGWWWGPCICHTSRWQNCDLDPDLLVQIWCPSSPWAQILSPTVATSRAPWPQLASLTASPLLLFLPSQPHCWCLSPEHFCLDPVKDLVSQGTPGSVRWPGHFIPFWVARLLEGGEHGL